MCLDVLNNRLPGLARYLQAVFIVSNFLEDFINLKLEPLQEEAKSFKALLTKAVLD